VDKLYFLFVGFPAVENPIFQCGKMNGYPLISIIYLILPLSGTDDQFFLDVVHRLLTYLD
jgi:hypothetical protein